MKLSRRKFSYLAAAAIGVHALPIRSEAMAAAQSQTPGSGTELTTLCIAEAAAKLRKREVTSLDLTDACLARIAIYNPKVDAFITVIDRKSTRLNSSHRP